uniref:XPG-I domain-containing protein n=1 Tax=Hypholoma sublateritium (strain FD-334 SS-4) TaxID=945553 RepID=A0A0D2PKX7_HYPSF
MGIQNLWRAVSPASHTRSLTQFSVSEGFELRRRGEGYLIIGIDASIWMNQAHLSVKNSPGKGTRAGENPATRNLFYRLCRLLKLPVVPIFVFDGAKRPPNKRGVAVKTTKRHWLTLPFQKFIDAFGFSWYTAPGEAEAELAGLNQKEEIDAIISEDSDCLVYGACCVIRMNNVRDDGDRISIFDANAVRTDPDVSLDRSALFLMAILCGGDYHKGLRGCGWKTACQIAQTPLADSLFTAATHLPSKQSLDAFLADWRKSFRILLEQDPDNELSHTFPSLAQNVTNLKFPPVDIVLLYAQPVTSWSTGYSLPDKSSWCLRQPCLSEIGVLCEKYFSWGSSGEFVARAEKTLWPGVAVRYLLSHKQSSDEEALQYITDPPQNTCSIGYLHIPHIFHARLGPGPASTRPEVVGFTVQTFSRNFINETIARLDDETKSLITDAISSSAEKISFWIPESILLSANPGSVKRYKGKRPTAPMYTSILPLSESQRRAPGMAACMESTDYDSIGYNSWPASASEEESIAGSSSSADDLDDDDDDDDGQPIFLGYIDLTTPSPPATM